MVKIGRPKEKKTKQVTAIRWYVKRGYSAKKIQKKLQEKNLGLRRKTLLTQIRIMKGTSTKTIIEDGKRKKVSIYKRIEPRLPKKSIPKKYRKKEEIKKKWIDRGLAEDMIFRTSIILQDIPVHSKPFKPNYLGFRLQAFSLNKEYLLNQYNSLKNILIKESNKYLTFKCFENFNWNHKILGIERCALIPIRNARRFHNIWIFRVEKEGIEIYSKDGRI